MAQPRKASRGPSPEFLQAYGSAMAEWSNLEVILCLWFKGVATIIDWDVATAVFFSARSFTGRADMFNAALTKTNLDLEYCDWLRAMMLKALAYNGVRNQLAHGFMHFMGGEDTIAEPSAWGKPGRIKLEHLKNADNNFTKLRQTCYWLHNGMTESGSPSLTLEEAWTRLRALPNEACSSELSQKQKGRLRQLQGILRKKNKSPKG